MKRNKHNYLLAVLGAGLLGLSGIASAAIVNSKHDLSSASTTTVNKVSAADTDETCVFCHTPHAAASATVPLWNKAIPATAYTSYSSTTMDGAVDMTGSTSVACLSCHDGTQAMDNIVNASGSGGLTAGGGANGLGYTWTVNSTVDADGILDAGVVTNLTANLGDDHPIAIPYGGGGLTAAAGADATTDTDFRDIGEQVTVNATTYTVTRATLGGQSVVWFDNDTTANGRIDSSEIRLYTVTGKTNPQVECASCHDPHKGETTTFLRIANTQSAVCVTCHVK
ncbi:MAG: cytochrome c3 family protein [Gammaproteobacteria bacterium]|nr:cytochrome c3 family protein [Gammaproteobacteria bacterium]